MTWRSRENQSEQNVPVNMCFERLKTNKMWRVGEEMSWSGFDRVSKKTSVLRLEEVKNVMKDNKWRRSVKSHRVCLQISLSLCCCWAQPGSRFAYLPLAQIVRLNAVWTLFNSTASSFVYSFPDCSCCFFLILDVMIYLNLVSASWEGKERQLNQE